MKKQINGVISALITPFTKKGEIEVDALRTITCYLIEQNINGLCPLGTAGEAPKLNKEDRDLIVKTVIDETKSIIPVIVGTGGTTTRDAISFTNSAKNLGASAALILPPWFFTYNDETLVSHYETIAEKTDFPIILYNLPPLVGYSIPSDVVIKLSKIDNIIGIKDSSADMLYHQLLFNQTSKEFNVIQGYGSLFLPSLILGGDTSLNGESNIVPNIIVEVLHNYQKGNYEKARENHFKLVDLGSVILSGTFPTAIKEAMNMIGLPGGYSLPPVTPLSEEEKEKLKKVLTKIGLL